MGDKTKIDWCDSTWNPVTGCLRGCDYCYARKIAERFKGGGYGRGLGMLVSKYKDDAFKPPYELDEEQLAKTKDGRYRCAPYPFGFEPTLHIYRLGQPKRWVKPRSIFVCSMADLFGDWVPDEWIHEVMDACYAAPYHRYLFLTKNPDRYFDVVEYLETAVKNYPRFPDEPPGVYLGATSTTNEQIARAYDTAAAWLSIEPILEEIQTDEHFVSFRPHDDSEYGRWRWVVIGAETGNRKTKVKPRKDWIMSIVQECDALKTPIFMKESLRGLMGPDFRQEYPWNAEEHRGKEQRLRWRLCEDADANKTYIP